MLSTQMSPRPLTRTASRALRLCRISPLQPAVIRAERGLSRPTLRPLYAPSLSAPRAFDVMPLPQSPLQPIVPTCGPHHLSLECSWCKTTCRRTSCQAGLRYDIAAGQSVHEGRKCCTPSSRGTHLVRMGAVYDCTTMQKQPRRSRRGLPTEGEVALRSASARRASESTSRTPGRTRRSHPLASACADPSSAP
jgi:hypothetical protein